MSKTSEYLHSLTEQEVFDRVVSHLRKQKVQSIGPKYCRYRHNGLMCAAGCLIDDEDYNESMESRDWPYVASVLGCYMHNGLIRSLQSAHDAYGISTHTHNFSRHIELSLESIAHRWGLTYTPATAE